MCWWGLFGETQMALFWEKKIGITRFNLTFPARFTFINGRPNQQGFFVKSNLFGKRSFLLAIASHLHSRKALLLKMEWNHFLPWSVTLAVWKYFKKLMESKLKISLFGCKTILESMGSLFRICIFLDLVERSSLARLPQIHL